MKLAAGSRSGRRRFALFLSLSASPALPLFSAPSRRNLAVGQSGYLENGQPRGAPAVNGSFAAGHTSEPQSNEEFELSCPVKSYKRSACIHAPVRPERGASNQTSKSRSGNAPSATANPRPRASNQQRTSQRVGNRVREETGSIGLLRKPFRQPWGAFSTLLAGAGVMTLLCL